MQLYHMSVGNGVTYVGITDVGITHVSITYVVVVE